MRHHIDLIAGDLEDLLQKLGRELAHNNEPVGKLRDLFQHQHLVRIWLAQNRVQRCDHGHFQTAQQMQDMTTGWTAEDAILVLQRYHVNVVEVQEFSGFLIRLHIILSERPSHRGGIVVTFFGIVDRESQQSSSPVLRGNGAA